MSCRMRMAQLRMATWMHDAEPSLVANAVVRSVIASQGVQNELQRLRDRYAELTTQLAGERSLLLWLNSRLPLLVPVLRDRKNARASHNLHGLSADQAGSLSAQELQAMHKEYGALSPVVNTATLLADSRQEVRFSLRRAVRTGAAADC